MKRNLIVLGFLGTALFAASCGDNSQDNTGGTSDTGNTATINNADTAGTAGTSGTYSSTPLNETDRMFAMEAASAGMMEVQLGQLAQQKGQSQRVKDFGAMMVRDHNQANQELMSMASAKGLTLAQDSLMPKHREHLKMMQDKTGREFDRMYISHMVQAHQEDVSKFQQQANNANDPDVKNFASKNLPILRMHLDSARAINTSGQ